MFWFEVYWPTFKLFFFLNNHLSCKIRKILMICCSVTWFYLCFNVGKPQRRPEVGFCYRKHLADFISSFMDHCWSDVWLLHPGWLGGDFPSLYQTPGTFTSFGLYVLVKHFLSFGRNRSLTRSVYCDFLLDLLRLRKLPHGRGQNSHVTAKPTFFF